ncbi:hypothetical protein DPMN_131057 [Dreissena polymorpha]|uniref:Uncharacterized protein n=1 Tax=Dreissena polymorpha TaxID=45954 RepID=A0A9D4JZQ1_DREPO|nr:hypothetical protein DPMN_131057 [Dreissena polymorpha]
MRKSAKLHVYGKTARQRAQEVEEADICQTHGKMRVGPSTILHDPLQSQIGSNGFTGQLNL